MLDLLSTGVDSWNDGSAGGNGRDGVVSALTFRVSREMMSRQCLYSLNFTMILNFFVFRSLFAAGYVFEQSVCFSSCFDKSMDYGEASASLLL